MEEKIESLISEHLCNTLKVRMLESAFSGEMSLLLINALKAKAIRYTFVLNDPRFKTAESLRKKLEEKEKVLKQDDKLEDIVEDIVGYRLVFPTDKELFSFLEYLNQNELKDFELLKKEASSPLEEDLKRFQKLGYRIKPRKSAYSGAHLIFEYKGDKFDLPYKKVELQIRTHFQDSWEQFTHPIYKVEQHLPDHVTDLVKVLGTQMEAIAKGFEVVLSLANLDNIEIEKKIDSYEDFLQFLHDLDEDTSSDLEKYRGRFILTHSTGNHQLFFVEDTDKKIIQLIVNPSQILSGLFGTKLEDWVFRVNDATFQQFQLSGKLITKEEQITFTPAFLLAIQPPSDLEERDKKQST